MLRGIGYQRLPGPSSAYQDLPYGFRTGGTGRLDTSPLIPLPGRGGEGDVVGNRAEGSPLIPMTSQVRHQLAAHQETNASRFVVPGRSGEGGKKEGAFERESVSRICAGPIGLLQTLNVI